MQVSGGHLLQSVRKLVATMIYLFLTEKDKCKSSPVTGTKQREGIVPLFV
jgi:hypothetical protein